MGQGTAVYVATSRPKETYWPDRFEGHHLITLTLFPFQVLLCVFQLVWHQTQFGLHVIDDILELSLWREDTLTYRAAWLTLLCQLADELGVHSRGPCQHCWLENWKDKKREKQSPDRKKQGQWWKRDISVVESSHAYIVNISFNIYKQFELKHT